MGCEKVEDIDHVINVCKENGKLEDLNLDIFEDNFNFKIKNTIKEVINRIEKRNDKIKELNKGTLNGEIVEDKT